MYGATGPLNLIWCPRVLLHVGGNWAPIPSMIALIVVACHIMGHWWRSYTYGGNRYYYVSWATGPCPLIQTWHTMVTYTGKSVPHIGVPLHKPYCGRLCPTPYTQTALPPLTPMLVDDMKLSVTPRNSFSGVMQFFVVCWHDIWETLPGII